MELVGQHYNYIILTKIIEDKNIINVKDRN